MHHNLLRPRQALNKAYLRLKTSRSEIEQFKAGLRTLLDSLNLHESEEHAKNHLRDFLQSVFYVKYGINTKGKTDLVIHTGPTTKSKAGVLLEVKRPSNKADMPTPDNLDAKAMHELLLYYMRERVQHQNHDLRHLIVTSVHEWFVFDALEFDRLFYRNAQFRKEYTDWQEGRKASTGTDFFYKHIAAVYINQLAESLTFTHFNLQDYRKPLLNKDLKDDVKLVALYKLLSPVHLLKEPFANDANSLDRGFYQELLHIIGLEEVKEGGRKLIRRKAKPDHASLLEATLQKLRSEDLLSNFDSLHRFGPTRDEQLFNVALELCITWMNRVLFLKLLEAQLISYHHGDQGYAFMSTQQLQEFDDLNELFFDVLAERPQLRSGHVRRKFAHIPYLNSSLFETTALEKRTMRISNLKDRARLPLYPQTVLRDQQGKSLAKGAAPELHTLEYLLRFLGSYDFGAEGREEIQEENKTLITASVLGLIFEKINGYRDGSFYTPGFITMYMSREAIRRAVVQRFNEAYNWEAKDFENLPFHISRSNSLEKVREYNNLINSLHICDPAVGSGHYLVSALNELIVVKSELRLLLNRQGKPLHYGSIEVQNDELIVTDHHGELFSYHVHQHPNGHRTVNPQAQELQEALFHEKQTIIENCLFGVDINPNSVKICRLRLWIELLKNAYYLGPEQAAEGSSPVCYANAGGLREGFGPEEQAAPYTELQTLPNIDINIKQGNSLLSRYALDADLTEAFGRKGHSLPAYRGAVASYKHTNSKTDKKRLVHFLEEIKQGFRTTLANNDPMRARMSKLRGQIAVMQDPDLFGAKKVDKAKLTKLKKDLEKQEAERDAIEANKVYEGAFEWRFEFPEVLDEQGNYRGFDVVLGNPPYIRIQDMQMSASLAELYKSTYATAGKGNYDIYVLFVELGLQLLHDKRGVLNFILPHKFMNSNYGEATRSLIIDGKYLSQIVHFGHQQIFDEATTYTCLLLLDKKKAESFEYISVENISDWRTSGHQSVRMDLKILSGQEWHLMNKDDLQLYQKLKQNHISLSDATDRIYQGLKTSADKIYIVEEIANDGNLLTVFSPFLEQEVRVECDLFHVLIKGGDSKPYSILNTNRRIFFPYINEPAKLIEASVLENRYPKTWNYLLRCKEYLTNRENGKMDIEGWYGYVYPKALDVINKPKIFTPDIAAKPSFSFDQKGNIYFTGGASGGYGIIPKGNQNFSFLLSILNSKVSAWYISKTSTQMRGGYFSFENRFIKNLPIATADEETKAYITGLVEQILYIKQADAAADTSALEAEIDLLVYRLYRLTYDEVLLVSPDFSLSRAAYESAATVSLPG